MLNNTQPEIFSVFCDGSSEERFSYRCAVGGDNAELEARCAKKFRGWINTTCPFYTVEPVCPAVSAVGRVDEQVVCQVQTFNATTTQCVCGQVRKASAVNGSLQFLALSRSTLQPSVQVSQYVAADPSPAPTMRPTERSNVLQVQRLADTAGSTMQKNMLITYLLVVLMIAVVTVVYVLLANRDKRVIGRIRM